MNIKKRYIKVKSIHEALEALCNNENAMLVAGGTDVMVNAYQKNVLCSTWVDISSVEEIGTIEQKDGYIGIGAGVSLECFIEHPLIREHFPLLIEAAQSIASPVIRKSATVGGNVLCENRCVFYNQSEWWRNSVGRCLKCEGEKCLATGGKKNCFSKISSDLAPALVACEAEVYIVSLQGEIVIPLKDLYSGEGIRPVRLDKKFILKEIKVPLRKTDDHYFFKLRQRKTLDFGSLTIAFTRVGEKRILVVGNADPAPVMFQWENIEEKDKEKFVNDCMKKIRIVENDFYSREYRRAIARQEITRLVFNK